MISAYLHLDNHRRGLAQHLRLVMEVRIGLQKSLLLSWTKTSFHTSQSDGSISKSRENLMPMSPKHDRRRLSCKRCLSSPSL